MYLCIKRLVGQCPVPIDRRGVEVMTILNAGVPGIAFNAVHDTVFHIFNWNERGPIFLSSLVHICESYVRRMYAENISSSQGTGFCGLKQRENPVDGS